MTATAFGVLAVQTSPYQHLKLWLIPHLGLGKDAIHIYVGVACFLLSVFLFRLTPNAWRVLIPGLIVTAVMETLDLRDDYASFGRPLWLASIKDALNTNAVPVLLVLLAKRWLPTKEDEKQ